MYQGSEDILYSERDNSNLSNKFKTFIKENLKPELINERNYLTQIKDNSKFLSFSLSPEINEVFIMFEEAPLYWIYDSSLTQYVEDYVKFHLNTESRASDNFKTIKEFYSKWAIIQTPSEKKYFSTSIIKMLERFNNKNNFMYKIYNAVIYIYEDSIQNAEKAVELLVEASDILQMLKINEEYKNELLYILNIYRGFAYLKLMDYYSAFEAFNNALSFKIDGVTAKFYMAFCANRNNDKAQTISLLEQIFEYDISRANYAAENASIGMLKYLNSHSIFQNIFYYEDFANVYYELESFINSLKQQYKLENELFFKRYNVFKELKVNQFFTDDIVKYLSFFSKYESGVEKGNVLNTAVSFKLNDKLNDCIKHIMKTIRDGHYAVVKENLKIFEHQLEDVAKQVEKLNNELKNERESFKLKRQDEISSMEKRVNDEISLLETAIANLPNEKAYDAKASFTSGMTYNFVFSSVVFLLGGTASYSGGARSDLSITINEILSQIIITGIKWAAVAFLIGFIVSALSAVMTISEKNNKKQRLFQKISFLKTYKEKQVVLISTEIAKKEEMMISVIKNRIEKYIERQKQYIADREEAEKKFIAEAEEKIKTESQSLTPLLLETAPAPVENG